MERPRPEQPWNPVENLPLREQAVERIVNVGSEEEKGHKRALQQTRFEVQKAFDNEAEKTEQQMRMTKAAIEAASEVVAKYGGRPLPLTPEHIHLSLGKTMSGFLGKYSLDEQRVGMYLGHFNEASMKTDGLDYGATVLHEVFHFNSFQSETAKKLAKASLPDDTKYFDLVREVPVGDALPKWLRFLVGKRRPTEPERWYYYQRRFGFVTCDKGGDFVGDWLNEAMTEQLTKRTFLEMMESKKWPDDVTVSRNGMIKAVTAGDMSAPCPLDEVVDFEPQSDEGAEPGVDSSFRQFAFKKERRKLEAVLDDLVAKRPDQFPDREAAFDMFARAYFTGNLLPLGRVLEDVYEDKRALRRLMEGEDLTKPSAVSQKP